MQNLKLKMSNPLEPRTMNEAMTGMIYLRAHNHSLPVDKRSKALVQGAAQVGGRAAPEDHPIQACAPIYRQTQYTRTQ